MGTLLFASFWPWRSAVRRTRLSIFSPVRADNCLPHASPPCDCLLPTAYGLLPTASCLVGRPPMPAGWDPTASVERHNSQPRNHLSREVPTFG